MATTCFGVVYGRVFRLTRLTSCGVPVEGATSSLTSAGFVSVAWSPQYDEGTAIQPLRADATFCVNIPARPQLTGVQTTITLCQVDPDAIELSTGNPVYPDADGNIVGFGIGETSADTAFALEVWSGVPGAECSEAAETFGYFLAPWNTGGRLGDFTIENGLANFTVTATTRRDSPWGVGPYDVQDNGVGVTFTPGPLLDPIPAEEHVRLILTTVPPPAAACGATTLDLTP